MAVTLKQLIPLAFSSAILTPLHAAPLEHWQNRDYIIDSFLTIALQNEHGPSDGKLHKWNSRSIRYQIIDKTGDKALHGDLTKQQLKHLSTITGQNFIVSRGHKTNLTIIFSNEASLDDDIRNIMNNESAHLHKKISHGSVCIAKLDIAKGANITSATVLIPVDRARAHGKLLSCIVEELTQIMGLPNDSDDVYPSIFNDRSHNDYLTGLDFILLKLLYRPELKSGMSEAELRVVLHHISETAEFDFWLDKAVRAVRKHSLENLLN